MKIKGQFEVVKETRQDYVGTFPNSITPAGIQRILNLMGGYSGESWSAIRLVSANPAVFVQKNATFEVQTGKLISRSLFDQSEVSFEVVSIEMYAGSEKVAEAAASLTAGSTYYITRTDFLSEEV